MGTLLKRENVRIHEAVGTWEEAVRVGAQPLLEGDFIEARYIEAIIQSAKEHGPYFVISPKIAMPHARPEQGAKASQFAITLLKAPIAFSERHGQVQLIITMAALDDQSYLGGLVAISEVLQDEAAVDALIAHPDADALYDYFACMNEKEI